jgi:hypothetical protein
MVTKSMKKLLVGLAAFSAASICASSADTLAVSQNFFQPRAFSANLAREMLMEGSKHKDANGWYGEFSATAAYQHSWSQGVNATDGGSLAENVNGLGTHAFWSGNNTMTYGTNNGASSLDSYQFGLGGSTTTGTITLNPIVYQAGTDLMFIVGSSANEPCFFAKIKAPVGVYNINPNLTESNGSVAVYDAGAIQGYLSTPLTTVPDPATTMTQAFAGFQPGGQSPQGDFYPMQYGLINGDQSTGGRFGDIEMTAGYRFISNEDNSFSVAARVAAPTGGKAEGFYMLEPIFGRGGNWGLGGYVDGHVTLWKGNNESSLQLKVMANAMHLFEANTVRSYDLIANGPGSKYLLVADYGSSASTGYSGQVVNLINYSTLDSTSAFGVEGDAAIAFTYMGRGWSLDVGYEFWGRSAETLTITGDFATQAYAVLGRQGIELAQATDTYSNACQPFAYINLAAESLQGTVPVTAGTVATSQDSIADATLAANRIAFADLDVASAQQATSLTSKIFTKVTYEWIDNDACPHLGVMGEFEISTSDNNALPQWGVSLIGGVSF